MSTPYRIDLFCRVIDNYGDIGVCWRLARQFVAEHGCAVCLWVDDLPSFARLNARIDLDAHVQQIDGVTVRHWTSDFPVIAPEEVSDLVIEAFACELPPSFVDAMARRRRPPAWINLEYLSAENWVEGCHTMASRHPSLGLTKHFFFPGFTNRTGGLPAERDLLLRRDAFQSDKAAMDALLMQCNVDPSPGTRLVSLFCYPDAPVDALFDHMEQGPETICLVPEGVARMACERFLGQPAQAGMKARRGALQVNVIPFMDQTDYDKLLWSCDVNVVRGEDSFVRAQWAARPFVWHIYPQDANAHWLKLDSFLARYCAGMNPDAEAALRTLWHAWNGKGDVASAWQAFNAALSELAMHGRKWSEAIAKNGDLTSKLIQFAREIS
jgi:uncharacterized repeat protein (TIGR03837 family)